MRSRVEDLMIALFSLRVIWVRSYVASKQLLIQLLHEVVIVEILQLKRFNKGSTRLIVKPWRAKAAHEVTIRDFVRLVDTYHFGGGWWWYSFVRRFLIVNVAEIVCIIILLRSSRINDFTKIGG